LLEADAPAAEWAAALRRMWDDGAYYAQMSAAATQHAKRPANDPDQQIAQWEAVLSAVAKSSAVKS
jgi:hypothetical protein